MTRSLFGVELGKRLGLGDPLPTDRETGISLTDTLGPGANIFGTMAVRAARDITNNRPAMVAADVLPPPFKGIAQGQRLATEGYRTGPGNIVIPPNQISQGDVVRQSLGFQPATVARTLDERQYISTLANQIKEANDEVRQQLRSAMIEQYTAEQKHDQAGIAAAWQKIGDIETRVEQHNAIAPDEQKITIPNQKAQTKMYDEIAMGRPQRVPKQLKGYLQEQQQ